MEKETITGFNQIIRPGAATLTTLTALPVGSRIRLCGLGPEECIWLGMTPPLSVNIKHLPNTFYCDHGTAVRQHYLADFGLMPYYSDSKVILWNQVNWIEVIEIRV